MKNLEGEIKNLGNIITDLTVSKKIKKTEKMKLQNHQKHENLEEMHKLQDNIKTLQRQFQLQSSEKV